MDKKPRIVIITGGGRMGYTARMLLEMERRGFVDIVVIDHTKPSVGGIGLDFAVVDEFAPLPNIDVTMSKPSPKRRALLAQLERAKLRRDKNAIRDLTRQLEKVW